MSVSKVDYIRFLDTPEFEFSNSYPCKEPFPKSDEEPYPNLTVFLYRRMCSFLLTQRPLGVDFYEMKALLDQCERAEEASFIYNSYLEAPEGKRTWEYLHAEYIKKKNSPAIYAYDQRCLDDKSLRRFNEAIEDLGQSLLREPENPYTKVNLQFAKSVVLIGVVMEGLRVKFDDVLPEFKKKLLDTEGEYLVCQGYDSYWSDGFDGSGQNMLGRALMNFRGAYAETGEVQPSSGYKKMVRDMQERCSILVRNLPEDIITVIYQYALPPNDRGPHALALTSKYFYTNITHLSKT